MPLRIDATAAGPSGFTSGMLLGSRYRLRRIVGSGGMATVWRAHDEHLDRPVAIKLMSDALAANPDYVARFEREARTAASVWHANLVRIYDYSTGNGRPFLVMEYLSGGSLQERIDKAPLAPAELRELAEDLLAAIACVHRAGVLHRDIKPSNVLFDAAGRARLTDFGIARLLDGSDLTLPGQLVGTPRFLAPELLTGALATPRSDLYSLGVLLDQVPLDGRPDPALSALIRQLSAPTPRRRPADAGEALAMLGTTDAGGQPTQAFDVMPFPVAADSTAPTVAPPAANTFSLRRGLAIAAAGLALILILFGLTGGGHAVRTASHATVAARHPARHVQATRTVAAKAPTPVPPAHGDHGHGGPPPPDHGHGHRHDGGPPPGPKGHGGGPKH